MGSLKSLYPTSEASNLRCVASRTSEITNLANQFAAKIPSAYGPLGLSLDFRGRRGRGIVLNKCFIHIRGRWIVCHKRAVGLFGPGPASCRLLLGRCLFSWCFSHFNFSKIIVVFVLWSPINTDKTATAGVPPPQHPHPFRKCVSNSKTFLLERKKPCEP